MPLNAPSRQKLLGVEAARGVAACLVVFYHAARHVALGLGEKPFGSLTQFGHAGVDFFFVLSGFIILHAHHADIGRAGRAGHYIGRRFTRVFPVYWAVLAALLAIGLGSRGVLPPALTLVLDVLLLPNPEPTVGVAWTLQYEMIFYACFLVLILHRVAGALLFAAWAVLIGTALIVPGVASVPALGMPAGAYCAQFFFGMAAAAFVRRGPVPAPALVFAAGTAAFLAVGLCENLDLIDGYAAPARFLYGLPAMVLLVGLVGLERQGRLRLHPVATALGSASYAIYLVHLLGIGITWKVMEKLGLIAALPGTVSFIAVSAGGIIGGIVVHRLVERPLIALARRLVEGRGRAAAPARHGASRA